ncbi:hypothetical protein Q3G72_014415 [Acer saccharum]|nr:hypothetical protein Q3G72_014415 [Acer saccharum]
MDHFDFDSHVNYCNEQQNITHSDDTTGTMAGISSNNEPEVSPSPTQSQTSDDYQINSRTLITPSLVANEIPNLLISAPTRPRLRIPLSRESDTDQLFAVTRPSSLLRRGPLLRKIFKDILKKEDYLKPGRLLGLDVSDKYVSLAVSDWKNLTAVPLRVMDRQEINMSSMADMIQSLISEYNLVGFIFGAGCIRPPIDVRMQKFIDDLCETGKFEGLKYTFWDYGIASQNAEFVFNQHVKFTLEILNRPPSMSETIMEMSLAVFALQGYLDCTKKLTWTENSSSPRIRSRPTLHSDTSLLFAATQPSPQMEYLKPVNFYKKIFKDILQKEAYLKPGRLLGLGVSEKYVSLAVSDCKNKIAVPLRVVDRQEINMSSMADMIQSLIPEHNIVGFVVGTRKTNPTDAQMLIFIDDLGKTGKFEGLKYTLWDCEIASKNAEFVFNQHLKFFLEILNEPSDMSETIMEKCFAVSALQGYLDCTNKMVKEDWD